MTERLRSLPLPDDPNLAAWASALNAAGHWAETDDSSRRLLFAMDELRLSFGDTGAVTIMPIGFHFYSVEATQFRVSRLPLDFVRPEFRRAHFLETGPYVLASTPGGREELRRLVDPELADLVDQVEPKDVPAVWPFPDSRSPTFAGVDVVGSVTRFFGSMMLTETWRGFATCKSPRRGCRSWPRRPTPQTLPASRTDAGG